MRLLAMFVRVGLGSTKDGCIRCHDLIAVAAANDTYSINVVVESCANECGTSLGNISLSTSYRITVAVGRVIPKTTSDKTKVSSRIGVTSRDRTP